MQQILLRHTGGSHPIYPYQLVCLKTTSNSSYDLSKSDVDYLRILTGKARTYRDKVIDDAEKAK